MPAFSNPIMLFGLLLLIPIIILYLLKPKPKIVKIPSIMFIQYMEKTKRFSSFLKRFVRDPLLLTQLVIISLIVLALADPFSLTTVRKKGEEAVVIIIDGSGSMQSTDVKPDRFSEAKKVVKDILRETNKRSSVSFILAENVPILLLNKRSVEETLTVLDKIEPGDTPSNIGDAMMLGGDLLTEESVKRKIYVVSDFAPGEGMNPMLVKKIISLRDIDVSFVKVGKDGKNVGIISFSARRSLKKEDKLFLTFTVRNYDTRDHELGVRVTTNDETLSEMERSIKALSDEFFYLSPRITPNEQIVTIGLTKRDDLSLDDKAYGLIDKVRTYRVLLLTSKGKDSYLRYAIQSQANTSVTTIFPPVIPDINNYDTIVLGSIDRDVLLPGTFRDIKRFVEEGGSFIILASDSISSIEDENFYDMTPVQLSDPEVVERTIYPELPDHEILGQGGKGEIGFEGIVVRKYYRTIYKNNSVVVVKTGNSPVIAYRELGRGKVLYMGINPDPGWSNLYLSSDFPILLYRILRFVNKEKTSSSMSGYRTGDYLMLEENASVVTPSGNKIVSSNVFLNEVGVYRINTTTGVNTVTVNLVNEKESNITGLELKRATAEAFKLEESVNEKRQYYREIVVLVLIILLIETIIYRRRGLI